MSTTPLVIVTGGSKGIGRACLQAFGKEGFDLVTCARNESNLEELKFTLEDDYDCRVNTYTADLSVHEEVLEFAEFTLGLNQPLAALINNTGVFLPGEIHNEPDGNLELQMATNLYSAYHLSRKLIPEFKEQGSGSIFNICSTASVTAYTNGGSYCISKFALHGFSKVLREELKPFGIRVSSVLPGATLTNSWEGTELPEERFIPPEDVANMIVSAHKLSPRSVVEDILIRPQLGDL